MDKDDKPFKCHICQKRFAHKSQLETHKATHTTIYTCNLCKYSTNNKKYLSRHKKHQHVAPTENECEFCGKKFHYRSKMLHHRRTHTGEKPNECKECGRTFNAKFTLDTHMLIHENVKPFQCSFCEYACRDKSSLRKHETIHTGLRPLYRCKECDKTFKQKWRLKMHVAEEHLLLDVRKYECGECGRRFKVKQLLRLHIRNVHERSATCECKICGTVLSSKGNIWQHMATHVDVRPYKCNKKGCDKKFKDPSSLRKHSKVHLNLPPKVRKVRNVVKKVQCDYCGVRFLSKNYLQNHILRKHLKKTQKFYCDMCRFVTRNKPSIVMHIKYGHVSESDRKCKICKKNYKRHMYLKAHYARTHGIRYKTKQRKKQIEIKEEPEDAVSIDLFEIEKQEVLDDFDFDAADANLEPNQETKPEKADVTEVAANLSSVPEVVFEKFYERHIVLKDEIVKERKPIRGMRNKIAKENARKCIEKLLVEVKQREDAAALERARQMYNERLKTLASCAPKEEKVKIKYFNNNKSEETRVQSKEGADSNDNGNSNAISNDINDSTSEPPDTSEPQEKQEVNESKKSNGKLKVNSHQCYICFKLFETKEKLIDHCKYHFDVCHEISLKKCPICQYVTNRNISRHLQLVHKIKIKLPTTVHDKLENKDGSRYYYEVKNSKKIKQIEIIPSIKNLNKIACTNIDKRNRERKEKILAKTKLVKKSGEWIVVNEKIDVNMDDLVLPEMSVKSFPEAESYMERMRNLYHAAKKTGKKILFPCENCDKICQSLAALKLHSRKHDPNAKPFKPKVWKHKLKEKPAVKKVKKVKQNTENRFAKPKPIVNKHKCENELKEFYTKNIRGGDIEFWQFLKIYNRMGRENVKNFEDLEGRTDFGIHLKDDAQNVAKSVKKRFLKNKNAFKRVVRISKNEHLRRNAIRNELRKKIAKEKDNVRENI